MMTQEMWLWIGIAAAALLVLAVVLLLRRGQRVNLGESDAIAPTLRRERPETPPAPPPLSPASGGDDLRLIKGLGPRIAATLNGLGITQYQQIAALDDAAVADLDAKLGTFAGRIARDNWIDQAGYLAKGDIAGFEAKYGKLDTGNTPS